MLNRKSWPQGTTSPEPKPETITDPATISRVMQLVKNDPVFAYEYNEDTSIAVTKHRRYGSYYTLYSDPGNVFMIKIERV